MARPRCEQLLSALPVLLVVDVESLVALGEKRRDDASFARAGLRDDTRPRDLERAVLDIDGRQRLVLTRMPGDVELRLVDERPHRAPVLGENPRLSGVLLDELDGSERVRLGGSEKLLEPAPNSLGAAKRVRRADDRERLVRLVQVLERVPEPLDVGRDRRGVLAGAEERDVSPVPARDACDLVGVRRHDDALEDAALQRRLDRVRKQRMTGQRSNVLPGYSLGACAGWNERHRARRIRARDGHVLRTAMSAA